MEFAWSFIAAAIIAICYLVYLYIFDKKQLAEWISSLMSLIVTVLVGIGIGFITYNDQQVLKDNSEKERLRNLLTLEISNLHGRLWDERRATISTIEGNKFNLQIVFLDGVVLEEAGKSGLFGEEASFIMLDMAGSIKMWNIKMTSLLNAINSPSNDSSYDARINWYRRALIGSRKGILRGTMRVSHLLGLAIKETVIDES